MSDEKRISGEKQAKFDSLKERWLEYDWQLIRGEPEHPYMHQALEEKLVEEVAAGRRKPTLRFWNWGGNAVVLGRFQSVRNEVDPEGAKKHDITITRRMTGGGAMFVEPPNTITYSIYAPEALVAGLSFVDSYAFLDQWVLEALQTLGVDAFYVPINDISSSGGKIGGAAQTRRNGVVLHHATMAYDMNPAKMLEVLRIGKEKLSDKGTTSAARRVEPLRVQTQLPKEEIIDRFVEVFAQRHGGLTESALTEAEYSAAQELVTSKFGHDEWIYLLP